MTYEEIFDDVKTTYENKVISNMQGRCTIQIDILGEGQGRFCIEFLNGEINVLPNDCFDNDAIVSADAKDFLDIAHGKLSVVEAYNQKKIWVMGDLAAVLWLEEVETKNECSGKITVEH